MKKLIISFCLVVGLMVGSALSQGGSITSGKYLSWDKVVQYTDDSPVETNLVVKYNIYRANKVDLSDLVLIASNLTNNFYIDASVTNRASYYYVCKSYVDPTNLSDNSNTNKYSTLTTKAPVNLK